MAKMFYSLEEAAAKLGKTQDEVQQMAAKGQLQEFKDRDRLMFKREQVDMLASGDDDSISLSDSVAGGTGLGLALDDSSPNARSGSGSGAIELDEPKDRSGISIFDTESLEEGDPSAVTRISQTRGGMEPLTMESVGSGSGLLDLTREADDTSLGADLLEDVYKGGDDANDLSGISSDTQGSSGLFETTSAPSDVSGAGLPSGGAPVMAMALAEPYDGAGSGLVGGAALGVIAVALIAMVGAITAIVNEQLPGTPDNMIVSMVAGNLMMWVGIFAGVIIIPAVVGMLMLRKS